MKKSIKNRQYQKKFYFSTCCFLIKTSWWGFSFLVVMTAFVGSASSDVSQNKYPAIFQRTAPVEPTINQNQRNNSLSPQKQPQTTTTVKTTELSLSNIVFLAVANNTEIKNAYLDRIAQKQDLAVAEDKFVPDLTPRLSFLLNRLGENNLSRTGEIGAKVEVRIPTGATVDFEWTGNAQSNAGNNASNSTNNDTLRQNFQVNVKQPLLRGAGIRLNRASIEIARFNETSNIINLKSTLIDTITTAIAAYRELLQAQERVKIEQLALKNAQESLEVTQALIDAGRVAPVDLVQNQANIASRRVSLLEAQNELQARRATLLQILDIDKNLNIAAETIPPVKPVSLDLDKLRQVALVNRPNYLLSKINVDRNELELLQAKDARRWDLSLDLSMSDGTNQQADAKAGLSLSRTIGNLTLKQQSERARIELLKAKNSLKDNRDTLDIELQDRVRDVNLSFSQLELAQRATQLSQRQLEIEQEKRRLGRGTDIFQLINLQDSLAQARNAELDANIRYLNSLTNLDQFLGTTLQTWNVEIRN